MKNLVQLVIATLFATIFLSCDKQDNLSEYLTLPVEPIFKSELPAFPALSVHIVQREYEHVKSDGFKKNGIALTLEEYLEKRLIELYPETAYEGMLEQAKQEMVYYKTEYEKYLFELNAYHAANGSDTLPVYIDEYREFTTLEAEIEFMEMTDKEIELFLKYEAIASSVVPASRELLDSLTNSTGGEFNLKSGIINPTLLVSAAIIAGYSTWRVLQSRDRAEDKTKEFYPGKSGAGQKGDAFRHIYVSVLLRHYITQLGSWAVMGTYETLNPNEHARDTYMDYHNNSVGRASQYWTFRGHYINDMSKWEKWATNAKNWANNSSNGVNMEDLYKWNTDSPSKSNAKKDC